MDIVYQKLASPTFLCFSNLLIFSLLGVLYRNELHVRISFFITLLFLYYVGVGKFLDHTIQAYEITAFYLLFLAGLFVLMCRIRKPSRNILKEDLSVHLVLILMLFVCSCVSGVKALQAGLPWFVSYSFGIVAFVIDVLIYRHKSSKEKKAGKESSIREVCQND